jgi:hypothetical protein
MSSVFGSCRSVLGRACRSGRIAHPGRLPVALALSLGALMSAGLPAAQAISFEKWSASNCKTMTCGSTLNEIKELKAPSEKAEAEAVGFRTAGSYVPFGISAFRLATFEAAGVRYPLGFPNSALKSLRVDVAPGVVADPVMAPHCPAAAFNGFEVSKGVYTPSTCPTNTIIGKQIILTVFEYEAGKFTDLRLAGPVYNLESKTGSTTLYGVALFLKEAELNPIGEPGVKTKLYSHSYIEGNVDTAVPGATHDYFTSSFTPETGAGLIESRLITYGNQEVEKEEARTPTKEVEEDEAGNKVTFKAGSHTKFLRSSTAGITCGDPTTSGATAESITTSVSVAAYDGETASSSYFPQIGQTGCESLTSFESAMSVLITPQNTASDQTNGLTATIDAAHPESATEPDISDLDNVTVTLPPGLTMNPSAGNGLEGCTQAQFGINTENAIACPVGSQIGTVELEVPTLPAGSLKGHVYLGKPASGPITGAPYTIYVNAESARYGVDVRLEGTVTPNAVTGQLTTTFQNSPQQPFTSIALHFNGGPLAPLANPLTCGSAGTTATLTPWSGHPAAFSPAVTPFTVSGCTTSTPPFAPTQSTEAFPAQGGGNTSFTMNINREEGQQYLTQIHTVLPPGLVGLIPTVQQCSEALANAGTCPLASKVGTVSVQSGSGSQPYTFNGSVYLTEKYAGAPYGLSIVVPAVAGPFNLGNIVTRATIAVNPSTAQVEVSSSLPMIVAGIPTRIRSISIDVNRQGYLRNPTNCSLLQSTSTLTGTPSLPVSAGGTATVTSPFQAEGCSSLPFKPSFKASTNGHPTRAKGAGLKVEIAQKPGEANIARTVTTLPIQLPSRLTTLQKACTEEQGRVNILGCPATSRVGTASATTPTLPDKMTGPAYIVSQGGRAFPNLDLVLEADGVRVILVGNTDIKNGITTTTFASTPDVPISSFSLNLPMASNSLLASNGSFCKVPLNMPTTLVGQNGKKVTQKTRIAVSGCLPIVSHRVRGHFAYITVKTPQGGRVAVKGADLKPRSRRVRRAQRVTIKVPLNRAGLNALHAHHRVKVRVRVGFVPSRRGGAAFTSFATVIFRG